MIMFFKLMNICPWVLISYYDVAEARRSGLEALPVTHIIAFGLCFAVGLAYACIGSLSIIGNQGGARSYESCRFLLLLVAAMGKSV